MRALCLFTVVILSACSGTTERYGAPERPYEQRLQDEFIAADRDGDEQLSPEEFRAGWPQLEEPFATLDSDNNGSLSLAELKAYAEWKRIATTPPGRRLH